MAATVTIGRAHFETLLRRAEFHTLEDLPALSAPLQTVSVPKADYEDLLRLASEYRTLKEALYRGGLDESTLQILINSNGAADASANDQATTSRSGNVSDIGGLSGVKLPTTLGMSGPSCTQGHSVMDASSFRPDQSVQAGGYDPTVLGQSEQPGSMFFPEDPKIHLLGRNEKRTILLSNLPERVTHKDLISVIRGGLVLDLYIRPQDRSANVSFAAGKDAQEFFMYAKRNDIYLLGKRLEVRWNERQFILPNHVARKLANGATRSLVLHSVPDKITEVQLRDDLEHIHNLVVVDVTFKKFNVYLSLNSVHNALFARTCMMSRSGYKGIKIDFDEDECTQSLPQIQRFQKKENTRPPPQKATSGLNRFHLLDIQDSVTGSDEDGESEGDRFDGYHRHFDPMGTSIAA